MHPIPTIYKGVQMRSRLEARWAAMFDALEWRWEYEPIDLDGYIPDFLILFPHAPLLAEIKPAVELSGLGHATSKIERSGWRGDALILGAVLFDSGWSSRATTAGLLSQRFTHDEKTDENRIGQEEWCWDEGEFICCSECRRPSIYHPCNSWYCYRCGAGGKIYGDSGSAPDVHALWAEAGNAVRWHPDRMLHAR